MLLTRSETLLHSKHQPEGLKTKGNKMLKTAWKQIGITVGYFLLALIFIAPFGIALAWFN